ncbi:hypothetical protein TRFO_21729 [Tritrichomonas foetus]|uniref:Uncharacterized protein n=1 Tax=Tritrichomonas foetus TaxID=1144522 RepID=A0A1J4KDR6_9EUKA|nr:hypothetical protein TRFO_21729 [Tritrichomonas foetus]|eukprot:OHT09339.1 hypothetical protein TRFO_21729 [Tritrichomonas foetus]
MNDKSDYHDCGNDCDDNCGDHSGAILSLTNIFCWRWNCLGWRRGIVCVSLCRERGIIEGKTKGKKDEKHFCVKLISISKKTVTFTIIVLKKFIFVNLLSCVFESSKSFFI